jgi:hypothetical protein
MTDFPETPQEWRQAVDAVASVIDEDYPFAGRIKELRQAGDPTPFITAVSEYVRTPEGDRWWRAVFAPSP